MYKQSSTGSAHELVDAANCLASLSNIVIQELLQIGTPGGESVVFSPVANTTYQMATFVSVRSQHILLSLAPSHTLPVVLKAKRLHLTPEAGVKFRKLWAVHRRTDLVNVAFGRMAAAVAANSSESDEAEAAAGEPPKKKARRGAVGK